MSLFEIIIIIFNDIYINIIDDSNLFTLIVK